MACTEEEFLELLSGESKIDLKSLREVSLYGIPEAVRARVWRYLLGVSDADKSDEMKKYIQQRQVYEETEKYVNSEYKQQVKQELKRFRKVPNMKDSLKNRLETVMITYCNYNTDFEYMRNGSLFLLLPFVYLNKNESNAFFCFDAFTKKLEEALPAEERAHTVAKFMSFFQILLPELFDYFEEEEVGPKDFASSWFSFVLSKELQLHNTLRLWDTYLSCRESFMLHLYVTLAILRNFNDDLLELENPEIKGFLQHLPNMDMDQIIAQAYNIKEDLEQRGLL